MSISSPRFHVVSCGLLAVLALGALPAAACYSGLSLIPTADTVGAGQYAVTLQVDGTLSDREIETRLLATQIGLGDRVEAGADVDLSSDADPRVLFDAKYVFARTGGGERAAAAGVFNVGRHVTAVPYLVGSADAGSARVHAGIQRCEGNTRWMAGVDRALSDRLTLMADYISGDENFAALGADYQLSDRSGLFAALLFPNAGGGTGFTLQVTFSGAYRTRAARAL